LNKTRFNKAVMFHGYFGMGNVGDEAILSTLINEYGSRGFNAVVLSADPRRTEGLHDVQAYKERLLSRSFWKTLIKCSGIVFAGGGKYGAGTFRRIAMLTLIAKLMGKSVEFRAVGFYPYEWYGTITLYREENLDPLTRYMIKLSLRLADSLTVRDEYSKKFIESTIIGKRAFLELDPALRLEPDMNGAKRILSSLGLSTYDTIIGLNVRFLRDRRFSRVLHAIVGALNLYLKENTHAKVLYIPFGYGSTPDRFFDNDIIIGRLIKEHLSRNIADRYYILDQELKPQIVLGLFKFLKAVISVRYHALVFAHKCRVPVFSIAYDTKILEYAKLASKLGESIEGLIVKPEEISTDLILTFLRSRL